MPFGMYVMKPCEACGGDRPHSNKGRCMGCRPRVLRQAGGLRRSKLRRVRLPGGGLAVSRRQQAAEALPLAQAIVRRRAKGRCETCGTRTLKDQAEHHHRLPRGAGGTSVVAVNSAGNLLYLCKPCHRWIEKHRTLAEERGWLLKHPAVPTERPVQLKGHGWSLLADDGTYVACDPPWEVTA